MIKRTLSQSPLGQPSDGADTRACEEYSCTEGSYARDFARFLACTDQKRAAGVAVREVLGPAGGGSLLDIGPGEGTLTSYVRQRGSPLTLIEPNPVFAQTCAARFAGARLLPSKVQDVAENVTADWVLLAHVLFHVPTASWRRVLEVCSRAVPRDGKVVVLLQQRGTPFMRMLDKLGVSHDHLDLIADSTMALDAGLIVASRHAIESSVYISCERDLLEIGRFMLNCRPGWDRLSPDSMIELAKDCAEQGEYPMQVSCSQDMLVLGRP